MAIHTPAGTILHTGDFKIDQTPLDGEAFDLHRFAELGAPGRAGAVLRQHERRPARVHRVGARRHRGVRGGLQQRHRARSSSRRFRPASTGCNCSSTWPSSSSRKVAFVGRGMQQTSQIAERLGYLQDAAARCRFGTPTSATTRPRTSSVPVHGIAGRADGGAAAHRDRRPPARAASRRRTSWSSRRG